jgi:hypothetical protein
MNILNKFPQMLVMRSSPTGMIWQAYIVNNEIEKTIIKDNAEKKLFSC